MRKSRNISDPRPPGRWDTLNVVLTPLITIFILLGLWLLVTEGGFIDAYLLPSPLAVGRAFFSERAQLLYHSQVSLKEAFLGLGIGTVLAWIFAILMDSVGLLRKAFYPLLVISQTIPTIAIAPLLVIWMGFGLGPKVALVILTCFFPITVNLLGAFAGVDPDEVNMLRTMGARRRQIFRHIKFPASLEAFFHGLKISASYAIVTAVVAEWLGGFEGLGVYMTRVRQAYAFDKMFAVIVLISVLSLLLVALVNLAAWICLPWKRN